ncbi:MAG: molybdopterin cofactor-binding domain-containing protein [Synergistes jonesii]|uniref:xanthine dehydrogenase family protein molybdopterin-binding subunit n=1 Tax=Synergistes jonesii TaxID=2754 RepID=UPI002A74B60A|nr:molybdopterin cofactor-binding domain-containing protein [Synergistes jonesii]MDY2984797.1 molybdopterin cofactor-binding domain-containing protein [Synergistes jonesii]
MKNFQIVGRRQEKQEAALKAMGKLKYTGDLYVPDMLHCKILRSPYANAIVKNVDKDEALKIPGVVDIITYDDVPKILSMHQYLHVPEIMYKDSYLLERHVRHVGDRVAAVAAETVEAAEAALEKIKVEYEVLPSALDFESTLAPEAPVIHEEALKGDNPVNIRGNVFDTVDITIGDVEKAFDEADLVLTKHFRTSKPNPAPLERTAVLCVPDGNGHVDIWATSQGIHAMRMNIACSLGLPVSRLTCHRVFLGGAFGAHIQTGFIENICTLLALRTGRPIKGEKTREEMFLSCGRHPMLLKLKVGFKKNGKITALHADVTDDTGAYAFSGSSKMMLAAGFTLSMYKCPNLRMSGRAVYTNTPPLTAMRGAGNPQATWAVESVMDEAAETLNIDPIELRKMNMLSVGDTFYGQGPAVISTIRSNGTLALLDKCAAAVGWEKRGHGRGTTPYPDKPWIRRGIGLARGFHTSGCGSEKPNKFIIDVSGAIVKMNEDGTATILNSAADCGGGNMSVYCSLVAEIVGLRYEDVHIKTGDTDCTIFDGATHASRGVYGAGQPIVKCAEDVRRQIIEWGARIFGCGVEDIDIKDSRMFLVADPKIGKPVGDIILKGISSGWGNVCSNHTVRPKACPPHFTVIFAVVDVNTHTGKVDIVRVVAGADAGTILNRNNVEGQIVGGVHMGAGYALMEDTIFSKEGRPLNAQFGDYKILTSLDMPPVEIITEETWEPTGPLGAKGIGEGVTNPVAPAIANAIHDACGIRIPDLPCTSEKILDALGAKEA